MQYRIHSEIPTTSGVCSLRRSMAASTRSSSSGGNRTVTTLLPLLMV